MSCALNQGTCPGLSQGGALTELVAKGAIDAYLTECPTTTMWKFRYYKYTNFVLEQVAQSFQTPVGFGSESSLTLNRNGDLLYWMYVQIQLPGIIACASPTVGGFGTPAFGCCDPCDPCGDGPAPECVCPGVSSPAEVTTGTVVETTGGILEEIDTCTGLARPWAHYTNAIGQFLVKKACLAIGGQAIDTLCNDYLFMWEELSGQPGKRLTEMIGKRFTIAQLVADSKNERTLYVPLPWWFTAISGNALPLVALQFHALTVHVCFETLARSIQISDCPAQLPIQVLKCADGLPITNADMHAKILSTFVYLDLEERTQFACACFEKLITQVQMYQTVTNQSHVNLTLNFNHPVIEIFWAVRRNCQEACGNYFNYSGKWGRDPIVGVTLKLNNLVRFGGQPGVYYRLVQPYQYHTNIPDAFIYVYSFSLAPEDAQPSGSSNWSRIDSVDLSLDFQPELTSQLLGMPQSGYVTVLVFARNYNILKFKEGLAGILYSN